MRFRKLLLGTVAASAVMVVAAAGQPEIFPIVATAQAATDVSVQISFNVFYDRLGGHGDWVTFRDSYVWVPRVDASWRPYLHGHWVYTKTYGWYWVSDEPFAWAVYHYGRWAFDPAIGWYWVPGRRWAPAWVVWSHTDDEIAWAPLPPDYDDDDVSISISISSVPVHYWHVVPIAFFVSIDLDDHVIRDHDHVRRVITRGEPETVIIQNNIVVNNFIDVDVIEQKTKQEVVVYEEKPADNPEAAGTAEGNAIAVFNPEVAEEPGAKPKQVKTVEEVSQEKKAAGTLPEEAEAEAAPAEGQAAEQPEEQPAEGQAAEQPEEQPAEGQAAEQPEEQPAEGQAAEQPVEEPAQGQAAEEQIEAPEEGEAAGTEQPPPQQQQAEEPAPEASERALEATPQEEMPEPEQPEAQQPQKQPEKQPEKQACDPAVEECPPQ